MSNKQKAVFIIMFAILGFIALQVPVAQLRGARAAFTLFDLFAPVATGFIGLVPGIIAVACMEFINVLFKGISSFNIVMAVRLITPIFAAIYFGRRNIFNVIIPVLAISAFWISPISRPSWYYALYWLIPVFCYFYQSKSLIARALGSTFAAHALGGGLWVVFNPLPASVWQSLVPITALERLVFASGIAVTYLVFNNVLALVAKKVPKVLPLVNSKYAFVR